MSCAALTRREAQACASQNLYQVELAIPRGPAHLHSSTAPHRALESCRAVEVWS